MKQINQIQPWIGEEEKHAVAEYLDSGGWLTEFKQTRQFEEMIAEYVGSRHCSVLSNGTVTLIAALLALGIGSEDEVIVPDFTMIASANAVVLSGAKPVLVDIDRKTLCLDLGLAEKAITSRTKAIMIVSLNGRSPRMDQAAELASKHGLHILEDSAQALGSTFEGKHLGTFGVVGSYSFSSPKVITTGQGGALVTDDQALFERISMVKNFGRRKSGIDQHEKLGYNFKFTDLQAVIGIEQMRKLEWRINRKKEMFERYRQELTAIPEIEFIETDLEETSPWFIDIMTPDPTSLSAHLKGKGIGTRPFYPPIHSQPPYGVRGSFAESDRASRRGLWLPSSSFLTDEEIFHVCTEVKDFYASHQTV